ncbi:MAG TPA: hypothetical protein PLQ44_03885, partial [Candidatus Paceibacterota bacterium]|nr:hypothetical protein [Candidatus Paceibacterota bacterium]
RKGWHVVLAYIVGFFVLLFIMGWEPADNKNHKQPALTCPVKECKARDEAKLLELQKSGVIDSLLVK